MSFETILVETPVEGVGLVRLNRPRHYNALSSQLLTELGDALIQLEADDAIRAIVVTGSEKAFAAGADIAEMLGKSGDEMRHMFDTSSGWKGISKCTKPTIGAVSGLALGGGFELALQCDILYAAKNAKFALPEVYLGVIPGAGGTQRVTQAVGKSLAMEMVLNGRQLLAEEALQRGVVSRVVETQLLLEEAIKLAKQIADRAPLALRAGKNCVNKAMMANLEEGLAFERQVFFPLFDSEKAQSLMTSFLNKSK